LMSNKLCVLEMGQYIEITMIYPRCRYYP